MKKKTISKIFIVFFILILLSFINIISAENQTEIEKAYSCLETNLDDNCGGETSTIEQISFSLLAMAYDSSIKADCKNLLMDKKQENCWGTTGSATCDLKSTAQAILALEHINSENKEYIDWVVSNKKLAKNLEWFLEIDTYNNSECKIKVNGGDERTFYINENKKISGTSSCLIPAEEDYYLKIKPSCFENNFTISCDQNFVTSLIYKKPGEEIYHISSDSNSASALGTTEEKIKVYCFSMSDTCDYGGSLWSVLALSKKAKEISGFLPYLDAMSDESINKKYFPETFLYLLTEEDSYFTEIIDKQKQGKYWKEGENKYYDSSLAFLSLGGSSSNSELIESKNYFLQLQEISGCWNSDNLRDTAFLLYSGWPKAPLLGGGTSSEVENCESFNYFCIPASLCPSEEILESSVYSCQSLTDICCKTQPSEQSCYEKNGIICRADEICTGSEVSALDTNSCCLDSCILASIEENECEDMGYNCRINCFDNEEEKTAYDSYCDYGKICCGQEPGEESNLLLIILLGILIILVILAIIFRNQLKVWLFKKKSKFRFGNSPSQIKRPPMPPAGMVPRMGPRKMLLRAPFRNNYPQKRQLPLRKPLPVRRPLTGKKENIQNNPLSKQNSKDKKDKEFEETMKRLRDMSE